MHLSSLLLIGLGALTTFTEAGHRTRCNDANDCCFNNYDGCRNQHHSHHYCTHSDRFCRRFLTDKDHGIKIPSCDGWDCCKITTGEGGSCY
ncbi:hypothetical protein Vi05172_g13430 [Venturia inaequalis]|nr:hypothetical protein Vi05172_g13430 [Venturia inaequalis]